MFKIIDGELGEFANSWPLWKHFDLQNTPDPLIVVVGAYQGKVMHLMLELFEDSEVIGYEPQEWACHRALERLKGYENRTHLHAYGLGERDEMEVEMGEFNTDACSFINVGPDSRDHGFGHMLEAVACLNRLGPKIDLMIMNIEGYEYRLLEHLMTYDYLKNIDRLAVQFHNNLGFGTTEGDMDALIDRVTATGFQPIVDQRPTWVYWKR
jgi:FkbM family methyltransferase